MHWSPDVAQFEITGEGYVTIELLLEIVSMRVQSLQIFSSGASLNASIPTERLSVFWMFNEDAHKFLWLYIFQKVLIS